MSATYSPGTYLVFHGFDRTGQPMGSPMFSGSLVECCSFAEHYSGSSLPVLFLVTDRPGTIPWHTVVPVRWP